MVAAPPRPTFMTPAWVSERVREYAPVIPLRDYQDDAVTAVATASGRDGRRRVMVVLPTGAGKAQPVDELVLTPGGWRPIGSIGVGDYLIGSDGKPTAVLGVYPQGEREVWRVRFSDGAEVRCDPDHLWAVATKTHRYENRSQRRGRTSQRPFRVLTTRQIVVEGLKDGGGWRHYVPLVTAPDLSSDGLPLDPYLLGVLLGDGGLSIVGQIKVHTQDDLAESLPLPEGIHVRRLTPCGGGASNYQIGGRVGKSPNAVLDGVRVLGLDGKRSWEKFIPPAYLLGAASDRLALLQGILDADGSVGRSGTHADYVTVSPALAQGVRELALSLGGICRQRGKVTSYSYRGEKKTGRPAHRLSISLPGDVCPFRYAPKVAAWKKRTKYQPTRKIVAIEPEGTAQAVCVSVDAFDHLYVTRDYILTHNTVVFGEMARGWLASDMGRVLVLAHRDELLTQAIAKLSLMIPRHLIGLVKAEHDQATAPVVVASVQTLDRPGRLERIGMFGLIVVDEAHHASADSYRRILEQLGAWEEGGPLVVGVTATPKRADGVGLKDVFEDIVYHKTYTDMMAAGYLVPVRSRAFDLISNEVRVQRGIDGDYAEGALAGLMLKANAPDKIVRAWQDEASDRKTLVFTPTVSVAKAVAESFQGAGIAAAWISGAMAMRDRREVLTGLAKGRIQVVANCAVLTEGFDEPSISCIVMGRPTMNEALYIQMVGRGTRPHPESGKRDCLILDTVGCVDQLGLDAIVELGGRGVVARRGDRIEPAERSNADVPFEVVDGKLVARSAKVAKSACRWVLLEDGCQALSLFGGWATIHPDEDGTYTVLHRPQRGKPVVKHAELDADWAKVVGESLARESGAFGAMTKRAKWHDRPVTEKQISYGRSLGLSLTPETTSWQFTTMQAERLHQRWHA